MVSRVSPLALFGHDDIAVAGGKGANLGELVRAGLPVPDGFVVTTAAYQAFVDDNLLQDAILGLAARVFGDDGAEGASSADVIATVSAQIRDLITGSDVDAELRHEISSAYDALGGGPVAVRSSATAEDLVDASFAGQQDTYLNVVGLDPLVDAVRRCWASLWTARAVAYRARQHVEPAEVRLAVVVQRLVDADAAGVMFTANPGTGRRGEVLISAAWGLGESVVSGAVDTDDLVVLKADGRVASRRVADKAVMTVRLEAGTAEEPVPVQLRRRSVLDDTAAAELARLGVRIEDHFGAAQDIEWVLIGETFSIVQSRPITALPPAEADPPTDWSVPMNDAYYFRASIVEQLPDPLSPLFADLIDGSVARSLTAMMVEYMGRSTLQPGDIGMPTVNGYAYYSYRRSALLRMTLFTPRALTLLFRHGEHSVLGRWRDHSRPHYQRLVAAWTDRPVRSLTTGELAAGVSELLDAGTEYYTSVQTIIPLAASSEILFTRFYSALVHRVGDAAASTFLLGFDSVPILAEKSLFDLAGWVRGDAGLTAWLLDAPVDRVVERFRSGGVADTDARWAGFTTRLQAHLATYGHTVYNLDFANAVPADDPGPLIDTLRFYLRGEGSDPYERQRGSTERREGATEAILGRLDPVRRYVFRRLLRWAQGIAPERENALADVGLAWPQLRRMLAELGDRAVEAGVVDTPDDIFWLHWVELIDGLSGSDTPSDTRLRELIAARQEVWRGQRRAAPPQLLPVGTWLDRLERLMPAASTTQTGDVLTGIGASAGRITATARVLDGPAEFASLQAGDILVAAMTTPAWTTLFARAAGVVTDVGGPLSHSSIVAREYGIPAVLGTGNATRRIRSGQRVTVDGDAGTVTIHTPPSDPQPL